MTLGGTAVSWHSKKQSTHALSAAEAEYMAAVEAGKECIWWKEFLKPFNLGQNQITLYEDNQAAIALSKNPQHHNRTKHIQVKYHWIREMVSKKELSLSYIPTKFQLADIFTKSVPGHSLRPACENLNFYQSTSRGDN